MTLLELLVVMVIVAVLVLVAMPSFGSLIATNAVQSHVAAFVEDARFARSEAMARGTSVTLCRVADAQAAQPVCSTADGGWERGWMVFVDNDDSNDRDGDEPLLRVQQALPDSGGIAALGKGDFDRIRYRASGRLSGLGATVRFTPARGGPDGVQAARCVVVSAVGRVRLAGEQDKCAA